MNYKRYNLTIIKILLCIIGTVCLINFFIDPYGVFLTKQCFINRVKPDAKCQERLTKMLSLEYRDHSETIFIGSSRVSLAMDPAYYYKITNKQASNMAMAGLNDADTKQVLEYCEKFQPKLKTVLIGVDIERFYQHNKDEKPTFDINLKENRFSRYLPVLVSLDATGSSFMTIIKNLNPHYKKGYDINGIKLPFCDEEIEKAFGVTLNEYKDTGKDFNKDPDLLYLKGIISELKVHGVNVIIFIPPVHSTMYEVLKQNGVWNKVSLYKRELAKIQPFYDFYYPSIYSDDKITPDMKYFSENSHCTPILGNIIQDRIFLNKGDYGYLVTSDNVDKLNKQHTLELSKWEIKNKDRVQEVKSIREAK